MPAVQSKDPPENEHSAFIPGGEVEKKDDDEKLVEELTKASQDKAKLEPDEFSKFGSSCSTLHSSSPFPTTEASHEPDVSARPSSSVTTRSSSRVSPIMAAAGSAQWSALAFR